MTKKEGGYKVPDSMKKQCPYCEMRISRQGWRMHQNAKHSDQPFVKFEDVDSAAPARDSGDGAESFRGNNNPGGGGSGDRYQTENSGGNKGDEDDGDLFKGWE